MDLHRSKKTLIIMSKVMMMINMVLTMMVIRNATLITCRLLHDYAKHFTYIISVKHIKDKLVLFYSCERWFSSVILSQVWDRAKPGPWNSVKVFHMGGRDSTP